MKTIYVGMSGGVDSSVAAALLQRHGYRVVGVYMKNWTRDVAGVACPWQQDLADARAAAAVLDIPFKVFDFQTEYRQRVVDTMLAEYLAGRTPNPDVMCNQEIKFKLFLETALADGADLIATGHYARIDDGHLMAARDPNKDQSYFLSRVAPTALGRTIFPLGELTKPEVRRIAAELGLPTATKPDSQGICFVGEVGIKAFIEENAPSAVFGGPVVSRATGETLGDHDGAIFYTIGQRHGLKIGGGKPYYVTHKDLLTNTVYVADDPDDPALEADRFTIGQTHWMGAAPRPNAVYQLRLRHRGALIDAQLEPDGDGYLVALIRSERAVSPGQTAVVYDGDHVLGSGIIELVA